MRRLVLFDIDGTLIENSKAHLKAFSEALMTVYGVNATIDIINHHGMTDPEIIIEVLRKIGLDERLIGSKLEDCMETLVKSFDELVERDEVVVLDGIRGLLEELDNHEVLMGLVTGNLESIARSKLKRVGLNEHFRIGAFGGDEMKRADLVRLAIRKAEECLDFEFSNNAFLFGDTPKDIKAGNEEGVKTIGVATGIYSKSQLEDAGADYALKDLKNTKRILKIILS